MSDTRVPTGIRGLDDALGGGVPVGSVVAVVGPAASPVELVGYHLVAGHDRPAVYVSTTRGREAVLDTAEAVGTAAFGPVSGDPNLSVLTVPTERGSVDLSPVADALGELDREDRVGTAAVVDSFSDVLVAPEDDVWRSVLVDLYEATREADAVAYLHLHEEDPDAPAHGERTVVHHADGVIRYRPRIGSPDELHVPKLRGVDLPDGPLRVDVGNCIEVRD